MQAVHASGLLDGPAEPAFDRLTRMAARLLDAPTALVSIVDEDRQFFKSAYGLDGPFAVKRETPLSHSFCKHVVETRDALVVEDARRHELVKDNLAVSEFGVVAYLGVPIFSTDNEAIGALCAIDTKVRAWSAEDRRTLADLSAAVGTELQLRGSLEALRESKRAFARKAATYRALAENIPNGCIFLFDEDLRFLTADGPEILHSLGFTRDDVIGRSVRNVCSPRNVETIEHAYRRTLDGESVEVILERDERVFVIRTSPVRESRNQVVGGVALFLDVTEKYREAEALRIAHRKLEELAHELRQASLVDELTSLHNRRGFGILASQAQKLARRSGHQLRVFFVDMDGMKGINDGYGHEFGDLALVETAGILKRTFRDADIVARLGGDEFIVLVDEGPAVVGGAAVRSRLAANLAAWNADSIHPFRLALSIGEEGFDPRGERTLESVMADADAAMYREKQRKKTQAA